MPCAFHLDRPERGCQFVVREQDLTEFNGEKWCLYHLPLRFGDKQSPKLNWNEAQIEAFNERVFELIQRVKAEDRPLNFWGIVFPGGIDFRRYASGNNALPAVWFDGAIFGGPAAFSKCAFSGVTSFDRATFQNVATFHGATFGHGIDHLSLFSDAEFHDNAVFDRATFAGMANFAGVRFRGPAMFVRTALHAPLFAGAQFCKEARFDEATFRGYQSSFLKAQFKGLSVFRHVVFRGHASFQDVVFEGDALFNGDPTAEGRERNAEIFPATVDFRGTHFGGRANFSNRRFLSEADFRDATFQIAPEFHNAALSQDTHFAGTRFLDRKGTEYVDAAMAYRTLKLTMESVRARDEEARFYAYEQQSLRASRDTALSVKVVSWLYEKTAMYGQSFVRPLVWLLVAFAAFFVVYFVTLHSCHMMSREEGEEVLRFALQQVFHPFGAMRDRYIEGATAPVSLWIALVAAPHSLLTFTFLGLFLLALRRRFRLN